MSQNGSTSYTRPVGITTLMSSTPPQPCKRSKSTILRPTMTKSTFGTISKRMISVTPRSMSWMLLELGEKNTCVDCFTSTTRNIPGCQPGNATTNSSIKHGPKHTRTLSRRVSFHLKTQESIGTKSTQPSITSAKKQGTHSDSDPSARHPKKVVHFYHLLQINVPDRFPSTKPNRTGTDSDDRVAWRAADGTLTNEETEPDDSKKLATAGHGSSHRV